MTIQKKTDEPVLSCRTEQGILFDHRHNKVIETYPGPLLFVLRFHFCNKIRKHFDYVFSCLAVTGQDLIQTYTRTARRIL